MQTVSFAGSSYNIPTVRGDRPWSGISDFIIAAASKTINTGGGNFTLLADINFGATFGLVSTYFKSRSANIASAGQLRLANTDTIKFRNGANAADLSVGISSNRLTFEGSRLIIAGAAEIVNADISASAAIAVTKLAALTASRALVSDGSGFLAAATTTATELGYVNGVTSAIQTQINTKAADSAVVHNTGTESIAGAKTFTDPITQDDTTNQIVLGATRTITINAPTPAASSRVVTIPDPGAAANFVLSEAAATINGAKTFADLRGTLGANLAAAGFKLTGLGAGSANGDSVRYEQMQIRQAVVFAQTGTATAVASTTYTAAGPQASITPTSASSRILVICGGLFANSNDASSNAQATIFRDSTDLDSTNNGMHRTGSGLGAVIFADYLALHWVDSPATTSSVTYQVRIKRQNGASTITYPWNPGALNSVATILLVEII